MHIRVAWKYRRKKVLKFVWICVQNNFFLNKLPNEKQHKKQQHPLEFINIGKIYNRVYNVCWALFFGSLSTLIGKYTEITKIPT